MAKTNVPKHIEDGIEELSQNGEWWRSDAPERLTKVAMELKAKGLSDEDAIDVIQSVFAIAKGEYGD